MSRGLQYAGLIDLFTMPIAKVEDEIKYLMQASIMLVERTRNRTVQQLEHVRGRAKKAGQLLDEILSSHTPMSL